MTPHARAWHEILRNYLCFGDPASGFYWAFLGVRRQRLAGCHVQVSSAFDVTICL